MLRGHLETDRPSTKYDVADVSGPFGMVAVRWRLSAQQMGGSEAVFGIYGVEAGLKYTSLSSCSTKYDTIETAESGFSTLQVFVAGYIKLNIFD
jgi:hypothetical protein